MSDQPRYFVLEPDAVKDIERYQIPYPKHGFARSANEAGDIANGLHFPVVLKVVSPDIIHKSDVGGVAVGLDGPHKVREGYEDLIARVRRTVPGASIKGVMVCEQADDGLECIVGAVDDSVFGPTMMFGLGGVFTEVLKDVAFRVAPLKRIDAKEMIREIKAFPVLEGIRGQPPRDAEALIDLLMAVSTLVDEERDINELDLNPIRLYEKGLLALDVRIVRKRQS